VTFRHRKALQRMACLKRKYVKAEPKEGRAKGEREGRVRKYNLNPRSCVCVCVCLYLDLKGSRVCELEAGVSLGSSPLSSLRHTKVADHQHLLFAICYLLLATWTLIVTKPASASHTTSVHSISLTR
jgi:hypothetical protein